MYISTQNIFCYLIKEMMKIIINLSAFWKHWMHSTRVTWKHFTKLPHTIFRRKKKWFFKKLRVYTDFSNWAIGNQKKKKQELVKEWSSILIHTPAIFEGQTSLFAATKTEATAAAARDRERVWHEQSTFTKSEPQPQRQTSTRR